MNESPKETVVNALALLALAGILILLAAAISAVETTPPEWSSQVAATTVPTEETLTGEKERICQELRNSLAGKPQGSSAPEQGFQTSIKSENVTIEDARCISAFVVDAAGNTKCFGMESKIMFGEEEAERKIVSTPSRNVDPGKCVTTGLVGSDGKPLSPEDLADQYGKATPAEREALEAITSEGALDNDTQNVLKDAFASVIESNQAQIAKIDGALKSGISPAGGEQMTSSERSDLAAARDALRSQNANLSDQIARLKPPTTSGTTDPANPNNPAAPADPTPRNPGGTFQQPPGSQPGGQPGGMPQMPGGGGGGGQPPGGNSTPRPEGTCRQGPICENNVLFSRNNQCVDSPLQQCAWGCSTDKFACAQPREGQQCAPAPTQPTASQCEDGTWKPKNTGICVTGWECVPDGGSGSGGTARPTAEISCQPRIADVGMNVAITYGCSAGTSEGSGFETNSARSGSATVQLATPAAGTNSTTFRLTCTNQGQSSTAQCEVQVGKAAIILVANPQSVARGETSQVGWVTAGMESCIVSSPDQSDFTDRNASRTNTNGVAETSPITGITDIVLTCTTAGGATRETSTTITVTN